MSNFTENLRQSLPRVGDKLNNIVTGVHPHEVIKTLSNNSNEAKINLKASQIVTLNQQRGLIRQLCPGSFSTAIGSGSNVDIYIRPSSFFGYGEDLKVRMDINNPTGSDIELSPMYDWFNRIEFLAPNGDIIHQLYQDNLWLDNKKYEEHQFFYISQFLNTDNSYRVGGNILAPGQQQTFYMHLNGNFIDTCGMFLPALENEMTVRFYFNQASAVYIQGSGATCSAFQIEITSFYLLSKTFEMAMNDFKSRVHDYRFYAPNETIIQQVMGPGQTIDFTLSAFNGTFKDITFYIVPTGAVLRQRLQTQILSYFTLLDSSGIDITGYGNVNQSTVDVMYAENYNNLQLKYLDIYRYLFNADDNTDTTVGTLTGYRGFSGKEVLRINTGNAKQNKVITYSAGGSPSAGNYRFVYQGQYSAWLAFGDNAAAIQAALAAMPVFLNSGSTFVASGVMDDTMTIGFRGPAQKYEPLELLYVEGDPAFDQNMTAAVTTQYVDGFDPTGNYEIHILMNSVARLRLTPNGEIITFRS